MNDPALKTVTIFILIIDACFLFSCSEKEEKFLSLPPLSVRVEEVLRRKTAPEVSAFGTVLYYSKADIYPTTEGYINKIETIEGDRVRKGELLARLKQEKLFIEKEKRVYEVSSKEALLKLSEEKLISGRKEAEKKIISIKNTLNLSEQKKLELDNMNRIYTNKQKLFDAGGLSQEALETVKMNYLKSEYEYEKSLSDCEFIKTGFRDCDIRDRGLVIPADRDEKNKLLIKINTSILEAEKEVSESELKAAEAELERINLLIKETEIRSPIDGVIGSVNFDIGEKVKPDSKMFTVFRNNRVFVRLEAGEDMSSVIKKGMTAVVSSGSKTLRGCVSIISPVINPETGTREIKILLDNSSEEFTPGSFARVRIKTGQEKDRIVITNNAIVKSGLNNDACVFIIRDSAVFKKNVKILYRTEEFSVIEDGYLEKGEYVCLDPPSSLSDGREVKITE